MELAYLIILCGGLTFTSIFVLGAKFLAWNRARRTRAAKNAYIESQRGRLTPRAWLARIGGTEDNSLEVLQDLARRFARLRFQCKGGPSVGSREHVSSLTQAELAQVSEYCEAISKLPDSVLEVLEKSGYITKSTELSYLVKGLRTTESERTIWDLLGE